MTTAFEIDVAKRRAGRIAFGSALIAGAILLYPASVHGAAAGVMLAAWLGAIWLGLIVRSLPIRRTSPAIETAAIVIPSVGMALMLPLLIHLPFVVLLGDGSLDYDTWVGLSCMIGGPTHLALAWLVATRGIQLTSGDTPTTPGFVYGMCVAASGVPFILLLGLPYMLMAGLPLMVTALTGLPMFALLPYQPQIVERERGFATPELPRALVVA